MRIVARCFTLLALSFSLTACTLSADLASLLSETLPTNGNDQIIGPQGDFGYIPQTLPSSLNKVEGHFGSISPNKYYFIAPKANSVPRRKVVKLSGGTNTELTLSANVRSQRILYTTQNKIFVLSDEYNGSQNLRYLRVIDKTALTISPVTCGGYEVALASEEMTAVQTGGNEFYATIIFHPSISGAGTISGHAFYFTESGCSDTGITPTDGPFALGSKIFILDGSSLHQMNAGTPSTTIDLSAYSTAGSHLIHNGDIYYKADVDSGAPVDWQVIRVAASTDNSTSIVPTVVTASMAYFGRGEAKSADGTLYYIHSQSNDIFRIDMSSAPSSIIIDKLHETPQTYGTVYPVSSYNFFYDTDTALYSVRNQFFIPTDMSSYDPFFDSGMTGEYQTPSGLINSLFQDSFVHQLGSQYFISNFDSSSGQMSLHKVVTNPSFSTQNAFPTYKNPHSVRIRDGRMYFLGHHDGKVLVYESDGTEAGTTVVSGLNSDKYRLGVDYAPSGTLIASRYFDIIKDGSTYFALVLEKEPTYLVEYFNGDVKYIEIPGALYDSNNSSIVKVENNKIYLSTPAHSFTGENTSFPISRPGQQLYLYDGSVFSLLLKDQWSFEAVALKGVDSTLIGDQDLILNLRSPYKAAGSYFSKSFVLSGGVAQEISINNGTLSGANSQDAFVFWLTNAAGDTGLYLRKSGVNQKLTANLSSARYFRWAGDQVYFVGVDSGDSQTYIWHFDSSETTPSVSKALATPVSVASHNEDVFSQFNFSLSSDHYFMLPTATSTFGDPQYTLWKTTNGNVVSFSDEIISEALSTPVGYFFIASPQSGADSGKKSLLKIASSGISRSSYFATLFSLRAGPSGLYFTDGTSIYKTNVGFTLENIGKHYDPAVGDSFYDTNVAPMLPSFTNNMLNGTFGLSIADDAIVNIGIANSSFDVGSLYRNNTGGTINHLAFPHPSLNAFGYLGFVNSSIHAPTRSSGGRIDPSHIPQSNSLLYRGEISSVKTYLVTGQNGLLAITF